MQAPAASGSPVPDGDPVRLERLAPGDGPGDVSEIVEQLGLWSAHDTPAQRPRVLLNMISTVDGRASLGGRSGPLSDAADRAVFHELRGGVDGVLVGAGTVRCERYGRMIPDAARRELRRQRGQSDEPLACIVSGRLALDGDIPLLREPAARVAILTASAATLPASAATVEYVRTGRDGRLDLAAALGELRARFAIDSILCEGGPHLGLQLLEAGLLDELLLSLSPLLAGGEPSGDDALRILAGSELQPPAELELLDVLRSGSRLFLRYGVLSRERVSRETMPSSSLAS
jgi:riboflavin biosynthesis pyrimidine reductase